ncbi:hypothetical protein TeGR_g13294 [Tetraparma gracilis]|uniref:Mitochondrial carrier domain-containing protein n=1 Tax=Tetraparma gracilis TaxID=2962635 RepID=A0ABQ6N940_9STRA|nr:hypothetical protein TeGR_g13294 [Tetraparma gracilis]
MLSLSLFSLSAAVLPPPSVASEYASGLRYSPSPLNVRTGATLVDYDDLYPVRFTTYLARFLLSFDPECQRWWFSQAARIPRDATKEEVAAARLRQFGQFAASVEIGLRDFAGSDGPRSLMSSLLSRFTAAAPPPSPGSPPASAAAAAYGERERREARRQICLLFALMRDKQPTALITGTLAAIDNATVAKIEVLDGGGGYAPGYGAPNVRLAEPEAAGGVQATARASLRASGRLLRLDVEARGGGYRKPPAVVVSPPKEGGEAAVARYEVSEITVTNEGSGYAAESPVTVTVDPPPVTARINVNDYEAVNSKENTALIQKLADLNNGGPCVGRGCYDSSVVAVATVKSEVSSYSNVRSGDKPSEIEAAVELRGAAAARPAPLVRGKSAGSGAAVPSLPALGGRESASAKLLSLLPEGVGLVYDEPNRRYALGGAAESFPGSGLNAAPGQGQAPIPVDPDFGPRGRSPIERERDLSPETYLRFLVAGATCCSSAHLLVTPIDVVKTKLQTDPVRYTSPGQAFAEILDKEGWPGFFTGWDTTFIGFFVWGGIGYTLTEYFRRLLFSALDASENFEIPIIIAAAAMGAFFGSFFIAPFETVRIRTVSDPSFAGNFFEGLQKIIETEGTKSLFDAVPVFLLKEIPFAVCKFAVFDYTSMYLYSQYPVAREDIRLSLAVSLASGCLGGIAAAIVSNPADCVVADMKKSGKKAAKKKTILRGWGRPPPAAAAAAVVKKGPVDTAKALYAEGGVSNFSRGLGLRMGFYTIAVSLQFLLYDSIRVLLNVGRDDLNLFLDVLGGVLEERPGDIM